MTNIRIVIASITLFGGITAALVAGDPERKPDEEPQISLEEVLEGWKKANYEHPACSYKFTQQVNDRIFMQKKTCKCEVHAIRHCIVRVDVEDEKSKKMLPRMIISGYKCSVWDHLAKKEITSPPYSFTDPWNYVSTMMPLYTHVPPTNFTSRYIVALSKTDKYYYFIDIKTKLADASMFVRMQVVLDRRNYHVRQIWMEGSNGFEETWDIESITDSANWEDFEQGLPADYEKITEPEIIRP